MCNPEQQNLKVGAPIFLVKLEEMYFLTGLSRKGAPISLTLPRSGDATT